MKILETKRGDFDYAETVRRVEVELHRRHLRIYARFDHHANAESVELEMPPTLVVVFGSPIVGIPVILRRLPTSENVSAPSTFALFLRHCNGLQAATDSLSGGGGAGSNPAGAPCETAGQRPVSGPPKII
jgi:hypothetical protein